VGANGLRDGHHRLHALYKLLRYRRFVWKKRRPEILQEGISRAGEGDAEAERICDAQRFKDSGRTAAGQKPSMGQDMQKGRRTEIEFLNGFVVREGEKVGISCSANAVLTDIVKRVERNELSPDPRHITELRLN